jgi:hypothetical protein
MRKDGKDLDTIFKKIASAHLTRVATCGACGTERQVDSHMRRDLDSQFTPRPHKSTDTFYCGCQDQSEW